MGTKDQPKFLVFTLEGHRFALHLDQVERVIPIVEITPLSNAPSLITGAVNLQGRIIPIADIRTRFKLPARDPRLSDKIVVADTGRLTIGLLADETVGVFEFKQEDVVPAAEIMPGIGHIEGAVRLDDGIVLINDLQRLLTAEEEQILNESIGRL